jgi:hypothetical protein
MRKIENKVRMFREAKTDPTKTIYYQDEGMPSHPC